MKWRRLSRIVSLCLLSGAAIYFIVYWIGSRSDAFQLASGQITNSKELATELGAITSVRLSLFGPFDQRTVDDDQWVQLQAHVTGASRSAEVSVSMQKRAGVWTIQEASTQGRRIRDIEGRLP